MLFEFHIARWLRQLDELGSPPDCRARSGICSSRRIRRSEAAGHEDVTSEVPNASDEEFGLDRLELLLRNNAGRPLPQLWELIMGEVKRHGVQQDDQTLLLLRVVT
jgi:hypothetical protein